MNRNSRRGCGVEGIRLTAGGGIGVVSGWGVDEGFFFKPWLEFQGLEWIARHRDSLLNHAITKIGPVDADIDPIGLAWLRDRDFEFHEAPLFGHVISNFKSAVGDRVIESGNAVEDEKDFTRIEVGVLVSPDFPTAVV